MLSTSPPIPKAFVFSPVKSNPRSSAKSFDITEISAPESISAITSIDVSLSPFSKTGIDGVLTSVPSGLLIVLCQRLKTSP